MIEIRHLHLIKEIAESGTMTRASQKLFLTQPSLSHQLKEIESRLGVRLFLRVNKSLILTSAGKKILQAATEILPNIKRLEKEIKDATENTRELRITTKCYTCYHWLPVILRKFQDKVPGVSIDIVTEAMNDPASYLLSDKIDIAITNDNPEVKGVTYEKLFDDEQVLLVPAHHPLAGKPYVKPKDFENQSLIIYKESFESNFFAQRVLIPAGITPGKVTKMQLTEARVELVKAGIGITILSRWLVKPFLQGNSPLRQLRIGKNGYYRRWYLATLTQHWSDPVIKQFVTFLKEQDLGTPRKK